MPLPFSDDSIFIAGHGGMVGSALLRQFKNEGHPKLITRSRAELDLTNQAAVNELFANQKPAVVIIAAAKVGGIHANKTYPADFIRNNLQISTNLIEAAHEHGTKRLLNLGSSCIYPKDAPQPIAESSLLTGPLEPTNEAYAIAKIAALSMCRFYREQFGDTFHSVMPCNLYGPGDSYHPENSHVIPGLIRRFHEAKIAQQSSVQIWGTGISRREFLHVDDLATACLHVLKMEDPPNLLNIGFGSDLPILDLAEKIAKVVGFSGEITLDPTKPDGVSSKLMDSSGIQSTGWSPTIQLQTGLKDAYDDFKINHA